MAGGGEWQLPRSYGPFKLGMSIESFTRLTGVRPQSCPVCVDNERFVALDRDQVRRAIPAYTADEGMDFSFFDGRLYHFTLPPRYQDLMLARETYRDRFGGEGRPETSPGGLSELKWQDHRTEITVNYRESNERVFAVNYYDRPLKQQRDRQEAQMFENSGATAGLGQ